MYIYLLCINVNLFLHVKKKKNNVSIFYILLLLHIIGFKPTLGLYFGYLLVFVIALLLFLFTDIHLIWCRDLNKYTFIYLV